jgi:xylulokinase
MMDELLLGIDVGTTNVKAALVTPDGQVVAQAQASYPTARPRPGWAEQSPEDWWDGVVTATRAALGQAEPGAHVAAIGVSGQGCAVTLVDSAGTVIRPALIWMDSRSEPQCEELRQRCAEPIMRLNGKQPAPYNAEPKLLWLKRHEPEALAAAHHSLTTTGYITLRLTGRAVMNVSDASLLFAFDLAAGGWSDTLIESFGLPRGLYPPLAACREVVGGLTPEAAAALGLPAGTPVVAGGEDTSSAGLAIGVVRPGQALLSLGTAGTLYAATGRPLVHPSLLSFLHVLPGQALLGGSMVAVGAALSWFRDALVPDLTYEQVGALAAQSPCGADGVIFLPYLSGELQPINDGHARGVLFGLSLSTSRAEIARAVMEGAAYAVAHNLATLAEAGVPVDEIRAVGGPTRSRLWCQIIADVCGRPVAVLPEDAGAPLGDALLAGVGVGLVSDPAATAHAAVEVERVYDPEPGHHARYQELFAIYRRLYPRLREEFATLAATSALEAP